MTWNYIFSWTYPNTTWKWQNLFSITGNTTLIILLQFMLQKWYLTKIPLKCRIHTGQFEETLLYIIEPRVQCSLIISVGEKRKLPLESNLQPSKTSQRSPWNLFRFNWKITSICLIWRTPPLSLHVSLILCALFFKNRSRPLECPYCFWH